MGVADLGVSDLWHKIAGIASPKGPQFGSNQRDYFNEPMSPQLKAMQDRLGAMQAPDRLEKEGPYTATDSPYVAKNIGSTLPEYDLQRSRVNQQYNAQGQQNDDALQRRFAAIGATGSGASIRAQQVGEEENNQARNSSLEGVGAQEAQTIRGLKQAEEQKAFQSGETQKQRNFEGQGAVNSRNFARDQYNSQTKNQFGQWQFDAESKLNQMDLASKQAQLDAATTAFNEEMQQYQAQHSGGLLGAGGFLGTGISL